MEPRMVRALAGRACFVPGFQAWAKATGEWGWLGSDCIRLSFKIWRSRRSAILPFAVLSISPCPLRRAQELAGMFWQSFWAEWSEPSGPASARSPEAGGRVPALRQHPACSQPPPFPASRLADVSCLDVLSSYSIDINLGKVCRWLTSHFNSHVTDRAENHQRKCPNQ